MSSTPSESAVQNIAKSPLGTRWKNLVVVALISAVVVVIAFIVPTYISEEAVEAKRREIARVGGRCEIKRVCPAWLQRLAGKDFHSFLDSSTIDGVVMTGDKIDDSATDSLVGLTKIRSLTLEDSRVTEKSLENIAQLKTLEALNLGNTPVVNFSLLEGLPKLETLRVNFGKVRNEQFGSLARIPRLKYLNASNTQLSDAGIVEISKITNLEELNISFATLGEHGLQPLQARTNLKLLVLAVSKYNPADLEAFKTAVPGCKVVL